MPLKVRQIIIAHAALSSFVKSDKDNQFILPSSVRIKLAGHLRKTKAVYEDYSTEHNNLVKRLGKQIEGKPEGSLKVTPENQEAFVKENTEALDAETEVTFTPLSHKDIFGVEKDDDGKANQVPIDLLSDLIEVGLVKDNE